MSEDSGHLGLFRVLVIGRERMGMTGCAGGWLAPRCRGSALPASLWVGPILLMRQLRFSHLPRATVIESLGHGLNQDPSGSSISLSDCEHRLLTLLLLPLLSLLQSPPPTTVKERKLIKAPHFLRPFGDVTLNSAGSGVRSWTRQHTAVRDVTDMNGKV